MASRVNIRLELGDSDLERQLREILASDENLQVLDDDDASFVHVVVVALDTADPESTFGKIPQFRETYPDSELCLTASDADPKFLLRAMREEVQEFLPQPLDSSDVLAAFTRLSVRAAARQAASGGKRGRIICVAGGKAGVGTTTVAVNLAAALQSVTKEKTIVVVDLNLRDPDVPSFLDMNPLRGLLDIDADLSRLDDSFLLGVVSRHSSGLYVMPLGQVDVGGAYLSPECVEATLTLMREMYDIIIIDCGHVVEGATQLAVGFASHSILVTVTGVPAVRRTKKMIGAFGTVAELRSGEQFSLVLNKVSARDEEIVGDVGRTLGVKPELELPDEPELANTAMNEGTPLAAGTPRRPLAKGVHKLASRFVVGAESPTESFLGGVMKSVSGRFSKPSGGVG